PECDGRSVPRGGRQRHGHRQGCRPSEAGHEGRPGRDGRSEGVSGMSSPVLVPHPDKEALASGIAARLATAVLDAQARKELAEISLTGGSMGGLTIAALLVEPAWAAVDPRRVQVWWGDERWLPRGHPE